MPTDTAATGGGVDGQLLQMGVPGSLQHLHEPDRHLMSAGRLRRRGAGGHQDEPLGAPAVVGCRRRGPVLGTEASGQKAVSGALDLLQDGMVLIRRVSDEGGHARSAGRAATASISTSWSS